MDKQVVEHHLRNINQCLEIIRDCSKHISTATSLLNYSVEQVKKETESEVKDNGN